MLRTLAASATLLALAACQSSGVVPIGPDTYMLGAPGGFFTFSGASVKADLYREAGAYCAKEGRTLMPVHEEAHDSAPYTVATAEIEFRCLKPGDPMLARPTMLPTLRIESGKP